MADQKDFKFELSLSVLNHLGRNLYRNFVTVLGEAISNAWDADANNVWIDIDRKNSSFSIKDDGVGMTSLDFQEKFLKIGYSKRQEGRTRTNSERPYIGAKGIGKLALLSCADRISIYTKTLDTDYVGGTIDNGDLDKAITKNLTPEEYELEKVDSSALGEISEGHDKGTIIIFQNMKEQMKSSEKFIRKTLAMSFKFSLINKNFAIHVNGRKVDVRDLEDLASATQFLWLVNDYDDAYIRALGNLMHDPVGVTEALPLRGFVATVSKPRDAKIDGTEERASIDLFVNGRLREKNILRHIPTQRIVENYLYGQIHFDYMDRDGVDPFTSSREGVLENDEAFKKLLEYLKKRLLPQVLDEWDRMRLALNEEGDDENSRTTKKERKAKAFVSEAEKEFSPKKGSSHKKEVDQWLSNLRSDAEFNISAYVDCFLAENLLRVFIDNQSITWDQKFNKKIDQFRRGEEKKLSLANISYSITQRQNDLCYLSMAQLSEISEGGKVNNGVTNPLCRDEIIYTPIRDAMGHTRLLTKPAKTQLSLSLENIKARIAKMLESVNFSP